MMRKIVLSQFLTLDGAMESPEKWNSTFLSDAEVVHEILADFAACDLFLFGKTTYDFFAARWPLRTGPMADCLNMLPKLLISSSPDTPTWNNTTILRANAMDEIKKLKEQPGKNIIALGSYKLVQTLITEGMVDEYKLYIYPLTLGKGKRLFEQDAVEQRLKLISAKPFASGVIAATYQYQ